MVASPLDVRKACGLPARFVLIDFGLRPGWAEPMSHLGDFRMGQALPHIRRHSRDNARAAAA
jgi:hypothetical protein